MNGTITNEPQVKKNLTSLSKHHKPEIRTNLTSFETAVLYLEGLISTYEHGILDTHIQEGDQEMFLVFRDELYTLKGQLEKHANWYETQHQLLPLGNS